MLVRNSTALRQEIMMNLRIQYINTINKYTKNIEQNQERVYDEALDLIINRNLGSGYSHFTNLVGMISNHNIFPYVESASIHLTDDIISTENYRFPADMNYADMSLYTDKPFETLLNRPGFVPSYEITESFPLTSAIIYGKYDSTSELWLRINIRPNNLDNISEEEKIIFKPIIADIKKIEIEYKHYMSIVNYFESLFKELPSLNQMHRACPSILTYVGDETTSKLFETSNVKDQEKLDELKPPDEVALALARNKLRGKH